MGTGTTGVEADVTAGAVVSGAPTPVVVLPSLGGAEEPAMTVVPGTVAAEEPAIAVVLGVAAAWLQVAICAGQLACCGRGRVGGRGCGKGR